MKAGRNRLSQLPPRNRGYHRSRTKSSVDAQKTDNHRGHVPDDAGDQKLLQIVGGRICFHDAPLLCVYSGSGEKESLGPNEAAHPKRKSLKEPMNQLSAAGQQGFCHIMRCRIGVNCPGHFFFPTIFLNWERMAQTKGFLKKTIIPA